VCVGIGDVKVQRLWEALHEPFVKKPGSGGAGGKSASALSSQAIETSVTTASADADTVDYASEEEYWAYGDDGT